MQRTDTPNHNRHLPHGAPCTLYELKLTSTKKFFKKPEGFILRRQIFPLHLAGFLRKFLVAESSLALLFHPEYDACVIVGVIIKIPCGCHRLTPIAEPQIGELGLGNRQQAGNLLTFQYRQPVWWTSESLEEVIGVLVQLT